MPADFDDCVKRKGKVRTININETDYMHVCYIGGKSHHGEVLKKAKASKEEIMEIEKIAPEQATAALKFTKFEVASDGTLDGTTIKINGKPISDLSSLSFRFYNSSYYPVSLEYCVRDKNTKPGELASHVSFTLNPPAPAIANKAEASVFEGMTFSIQALKLDQNLIDHEPKKGNPYKAFGHSK